MKQKLLVPRIVATISYLLTAPIFGYYVGCKIANGYDLESRILGYYFGLFLGIFIFILLIENIFANIYKIKNKSINIICLSSIPISLISYLIFGIIIEGFFPYKAEWLPIKGPYGFVTADFIAHLFLILLPIIMLNIFYYILHRKTNG
jgi:hypothetical protein